MPRLPPAIRLADVVAPASRCAASRRRARLAENHGRPSLWVFITDPWYPGLWNRAFTLTGPAAPNHAEVADIISDATGRRVVFEHLSEETWAAESGMDAGAAADMNDLFRGIRAGRMAPVTDDVERVTGRPAIAFADFARDHAEELAR